TTPETTTPTTTPETTTPTTTPETTTPTTTPQTTTPTTTPETTTLTSTPETTTPTTTPETTTSITTPETTTPTTTPETTTPTTTPETTTLTSTPETTTPTTTPETTTSTTTPETTTPTTTPETTTPTTTPETTTPTTPTSTITTATTMTSDASCVPVRFIRMNLIRVKSVEIAISWDTNNGFNRARYEVTLFRADIKISTITTNKKKAVFRDLMPDVEYQVFILVITCNQRESIRRTIRTRSKVLGTTTRIKNKNFLPEFRDKNSQEYKQFTENFIKDLLSRLKSKFLDLFNRGKMRIVVLLLEPGSVTVKFDIVFSAEENVTIPEVKETFVDSLNRSQEFDIDLENTTIVDRDSCQPGLNDCSGNGTCIRLNATYTCQCNAGFTDTSPNTPGRTCEGRTLSEVNTALGHWVKTTFAPTDCFYLILVSDIDECQTGNNTCSDFAACTNTPGNYSCGCFQGILDINPANPGTQCRDPNACFINKRDICALSDCMLITTSDCNHKIAFRMKATFSTEEFSNDLKNPASEAYRSLSANFINTVVPTTQTKLNDKSFNISIIGFQNGSVEVNFLAVLNNNSTVNTTTLLNAVGGAIKALDSNSLVIITGTTQLTTEAPIQPQTVPTVQSKPGSENPGWRVTVIVLGAVLGVALLIILAVVVAMIYIKKNCRKYDIGGSDIVRQINYSNI
ncbi:uromodulin-like 1, partial [Heptranchias perlo]|uniref:uromodulin-like 1 n=1 Tax=Heptranchias perlo TaxID=212740 RepID=UPI00355A9036